MGAHGRDFQRRADVSGDRPCLRPHGDVVGALAHPFHPLYPLAIALLRGVLSLPEGDALVAAAGIVSVSSGGVAVGCLWAWLRSAFGREAAAVGALALAVHPGAVGMAADVQSDGLYLALFVAAVAASGGLRRCSSFARAGYRRWLPRATRGWSGCGRPRSALLVVALAWMRVTGAAYR